MIGLKTSLDDSEFISMKRTIASAQALKKQTQIIADMAFARWMELTQEQLLTSREAYIQGIQPIQIKGAKVLLELQGSLPNLIENGAPHGFDFRDILLKPKGLTHLAIPFRSFTPGTSGIAKAGRIMGAPYSRHVGLTAAEKLGYSIHQQAKTLGPGDRLTAGVGGIGKLIDRHTTDLYEGMQRIKTGKGKGNARYVTFRTISENSDPMSWHYPPMTGKRLLAQLVKELPEMFKKTVNAALKGVSKARKR